MIILILIKKLTNYVLTDLISRTLSEKDIEFTPGKYHLLITNTLNENNPFSHLNIYNIKNMTLSRIKKPDKKDVEFFKKLLNLENKVIEEWKKEVYGFSNTDDLFNNPELLERIYLINQGYIEPSI